MTDGGGAETPNIAAMPAIAWLGACESARGPDAGRHAKLLIQFAVIERFFDRLFHLHGVGSAVIARRR